MGKGGEWGNGIWTDFRRERRMKLQFQGVGARPCLLEHRDGLARGIYLRLAADDRYPKERITTEPQYCFSNLIHSSGYSAHQMVFGSNPANLYEWGDDDEDLTFALEASISR